MAEPVDVIVSVGFLETCDCFLTIFNGATLEIQSTSALTKKNTEKPKLIFYSNSLMFVRQPLLGSHYFLGGMLLTCTSNSLYENVQF